MRKINILFVFTHKSLVKGKLFFKMNFARKRFFFFGAYVRYLFIIILLGPGNLKVNTVLGIHCSQILGLFLDVNVPWTRLQRRRVKEKNVAPLL